MTGKGTEGLMDYRFPRSAYPHGDAIWEHKRGKVWRIVERQEREIRALRYANRALQVRLRKAVA